MSSANVSDKSESICNLFKNMNLSVAVESDNLALSWLEKRGKVLVGYVDGCWLNKEKIEKDIKSELELQKVYDSCTGKPICDVYISADNNLLSYAEKNSAAGFQKWSSLTVMSRAKILYNIAQTIEKYQQLFAVIEAISSGKHVSEVKSKDVPNLIESFNYYADCALQLENSSKSKTWFPAGPVCVVTEKYNNPSLTLTFRVSSLLAAGNSVLLLADVNSSLSAFLLAEICFESGVPEGVLNVIPVDQEKIENLKLSSIFSKFIFTGSFKRSVSCLKISSKAHTPCEVLVPRRPVVIVYEYADLRSAANGVLEAFLYHDTRSTSGGCKVLIQETIHKRFLEILSDCFAQILVGGNMSKTDLSCIVTAEQKAVLTEYIEKAVKQKAKITSISNIENENCEYTRMMPVLISGLQTNFKLVNEELGGPIIVSVPFRTVKESISMFNCDNKGSPVSIWSEKISVALEVTQKLKTGIIWVNSVNVIDTRTSFNGIYLSGNSVEGGKDAFFSHLSLTMCKEITFDKSKEYYDWVLSSKETQSISSSLQAIKEGIKQYKLFIGGTFKCSDNGTIQFNENTLIPSGSVNDLNSAVSSAVSAQPKWEAFTDSQKRKIFFAIIDKLKKANNEYVSELQKVSGSSVDVCQEEFNETIDLLYYWATQNDKFSGPVQEIKKNVIVLQKRDPIGVIGIQCPDKKPLLSLVSLVTPAIVFGNAVVAIASSKYPTLALKMCEVFSSANVPGGIINIISGDKFRLIPALCKHMDVNAIWFTDAPHKVIYTHCNVTQRTFYCNEIWTDFNEAKGLKCAMESTFTKTVFLPAGEIFAN